MVEKPITHDQLLEIPVDAPYGWALSKIKVGTKNLALSTKQNDYSYDKIVFSKRTFISREWLEISASRTKTENVVEQKTCDLGHTHNSEVKKKVDYTASSVMVPWEHVDALIEWLQLGSWSDIRMSGEKRTSG